MEGLQVLELLDNRHFWANVQSLCKLLEPFSLVIMGIQADKSTFAGCARYWIYLARVLRTDALNMGLSDGTFPCPQKGAAKLK